MVPTGTVDPDPGYWLVGSDGGIFSFGSAGFHGSTGDLVLQRPVVGMVPTADHGGYWEVASDGGVFAFGDAGFHGSLPGLGIGPAGGTGPGPHLNAPVVAIVPSFDGGGYFMVAADGGVFAFGDATFAGSCPGIGTCPGSAVAVLPDATGTGYWLVTSVGAVYAFGTAYLRCARGHARTHHLRPGHGRRRGLLDPHGRRVGLRLRRRPVARQRDRGGWRRPGDRRLRPRRRQWLLGGHRVRRGQRIRHGPAAGRHVPGPSQRVDRGGHRHLSRCPPPWPWTPPPPAPPSSSSWPSPRPGPACRPSVGSPSRRRRPPPARARTPWPG